MTRLTPPALVFGSLFSGIGGFDLGFERAGMKCAWQCEKDKAAASVLARRFGVPIYDDVTAIGAGAPTVDLICGGFPCQDVSVAGRRAGLAGERSGLWFEFHRILSELRPRWVVVENVPGLLSSCGCPTCGAMRRLLRIHTYLRRKRKINKSCAICHAAGRLLASHRGRDFAVILHGLGELGYLSAWRVLDSQYFGVAQRRRRVFIVASLGDGRAAEILFEREGVPGDTAPRRETGEDASAVSGTLSANRGGTDRPAGNANELDFCVPVARPLGSHKESYRNDLDGGAFVVARSQTARNERYDGETENFITHTLRSEGHDASEGGTGRGTPLVAHTVTANYGKQLDNSDRNGGPPNLIFEPRFARNGRGAPDTIAPPLKAQNGGTGKGDGAPVTFGLMPRRGQFSDGDYSPTVSAGSGGMGAPGVSGRAGVRRLMPIECERLQGFPDGWTDEQADSARYRQLGNAVTVNVAEWLGKRIVAVEHA